MTISRVIGSLALLAGALLAAQGCGNAGPTADEGNVGDTGSVVLALMNAPADAACLRLTAKGATTALRSFGLSPGQSTSLSAGGLPLGQVVFTAEGFSTACSTVTDMSVATWVSDAVSATLSDGQTATVQIALHRPGSATIGVSFPDPATCDGTPGQWDGCRGTGCFVCSEKLTDFPRYFTNHPGCVKNDTCAGQFFTCNAACPAPADADRDPAVCNGTQGQWDGCRGTGCSVCSEKLADFPRYFANHPSCLKNDTCAGQFFTCNAACPAPADADRNPTTSQSFEAESGVLSAPMVSVGDASASGGKFIWSGTTTTTAATPPTTGHATYSFTLATAQTVTVWGRFFVGPAAGTDDSLYVRLDNGAWTVWNDITTRQGNTAWGWDRAHDSPAGNTNKSWALASGSHTLEISYREDGLKMDRFVVTSDLVSTPQ